MLVMTFKRFNKSTLAKAWFLVARQFCLHSPARVDRELVSKCGKLNRRKNWLELKVAMAQKNVWLRLN